MVQPTHLLPQHDARHDRRTRAPQAAAQRDGVLDVHVRLSGEGALAVAPQHVQRDAGDEVAGWVERNIARVLALALIRNAAVERVLRGRGAVNGHGQLEVDGEGEPDDVEARPDVGRRARRADREGLRGRHCCWRACRRVVGRWFALGNPNWRRIAVMMGRDEGKICEGARSRRTGGAAWRGCQDREPPHHPGQHGKSPAMASSARAGPARA